MKRKSDPVRISQVMLSKDMTIQDELECIANHTLCGVIQQLSNLNHHAADMFEDLSAEAVTIFNRTKKLQTHVGELIEKYKHWNKQRIAASFDNIDVNEKSLSVHFDQQIISVDSRPKSIKTMYETANPPPAITKMNQFRDDGMDGLKMYTDPTFFIIHWSSQMEKKETEQKEKRRRRERKTRRQHGGGPRKVKIKRDELIQKAKGVEYSPDFVHSEQDTERKHKKHKKKKMEGFSNRQWEKQHRSMEKNEDQTETKDEVENGTEVTRDQQQDDESEDVPPPVPMRKHGHTETCEESELPPPPSEDWSRDDVNSFLPPPPIPIENDTEIYTRQSVSFPPAPLDFYQSDNATSRFTKRYSTLRLPPPPPNLTANNTDMESIMLPPPPFELESDMPHTNPNTNRTSTFVLPPVMKRSATPEADYPDIEEEPDPDAGSTPPAPPLPPPAPGLPPAPSLPEKNTNPTTAVEHKSSVGMFDKDSLIKMKEKLKQAKERTTAPAKSNPNQFDVHSIMNKALENHRKFIEESSSEDESLYSDSDSDWE